MHWHKWYIYYVWAKEMLALHSWRSKGSARESSEPGASPAPHNLTKTLNKPPDEWCLWISVPLISVTITVWKIAPRIWRRRRALVLDKHKSCIMLYKKMQRPFPPAKLCISYLAPLSHLKPLYQKYRQHLMVKKKRRRKKKNRAGRETLH